ncbi:ABC-three component system protein [Chryseobacterium arthrosphaerae]|uniref:ABC-three component system protein n=1 Tax=Chryseobacterium arthrosphaerae TaxID=651561 RepID=UPI001F4B9A2B|nr:ABC-three component system protein [Chryseobacterium arthrosphaerae]MDG4654748.1 hypothetical protein [Chryseobacterium arthrosphaerae]
MTTKAREISFTKPAVKRRISALEIMQGTIIPPIQHVQLMSADDYELYTLEWVDGYLGSKYNRIRLFAGAGDKGRDVVGYYDDDNVDIYQCKHYDDKLAPGTLYTELGKLCYYTLNKDYPVPLSYFIVAPKGCGPSLLDLINNPTKFNQGLLDNWEKQCKGKITKKQNIELSKELREHIESFDFSIVKDIAPHELIEQHSKTKYHIIRFGGGIKKYREFIPQADLEIQTREQQYTTMLFEVYEQRLMKSIPDAKTLQSVDKVMYKHFGTQRNAFYSAESLEKFSRENFPDSDPMPFEDLKDEAENVLLTTLEINSSKSGYERMLLASQEIKRQSFPSSPLTNEIKNLDKDGLCHHLANEDRLKWIDNV